jgi:hypothetical protein
MGKPVLVEVIAYAPTAFYHCTHCEVAFREMGASNRRQEEQLQSSLPPELIREYEAISAWVKGLFNQHCDEVVVRVIDAASIEGFYKSLRHNLHRYPAVIIDGKARFSGSQSLDAAGRSVSERLATQAAAM